MLTNTQDADSTHGAGNGHIRVAFLMSKMGENEEDEVGKISWTGLDQEGKLAVVALDLFPFLFSSPNWFVNHLPRR